MRKFAMTVSFAALMWTPAVADDWIVGLPETLPVEAHVLEEPMWSLFIEDVRLGDTLRVLNGTNPAQIAVIKVPDDKAYERNKRRARQFKTENAAIYSFMQSISSGSAAVNIAGSLRHAALNRLDVDTDVAILILGDVAQSTGVETGFAMRNETGVFRIPTDKHVTSALGQTPWGLGAEGTEGLKEASVHLCHVGRPLSSDEDDALSRFWALYVEQRGGILATWSDDIQTCFERFTARVSNPVIAADLDPNDQLLQMREINRTAFGVQVATDGKTILNGVEVEDFNLFADQRHPTLRGVQVVTGIRYNPSDYPTKYEASWCYFSIIRSGTTYKFDLGDKKYNRSAVKRRSTASSLEAAGISNADFEAGHTACQWPKP